MNIQVIGASKESFKRTFRKSESHNHPELFCTPLLFRGCYIESQKNINNMTRKLSFVASFPLIFCCCLGCPALVSCSFFLFSLSIIPSGRCFFKAWNNLKEVWQAKIQRLSLKTPWRLRFAPHLLLKEYEAMYQIPTNTDINNEYIKMNTFSINGSSLILKEIL